MTMSPKRRSPARRRTRVGVSLQLAAMLAAGVALVAAPFGVATQSAGAAPLGATALVSDYAPSSAHPFSDADLAPAAQLQRGSPASRRTACNGGGGLPRLLGDRLPRPARGPGLRRRRRRLPHRGERAHVRHDHDAVRRGLGLGGPRWRPGDEVHAPGLHRRDRGPARHPADRHRRGWATGATSRPCTTNYLHFEVRERGVTGTRVDPGSLLACTASAGRVSLPGALQRRHARSTRCPSSRSRTPAGDVVVHHRRLEQHPARPTADAPSRAPSAAKLTWSTPPAGTTSVRVAAAAVEPERERWNASRSTRPCPVLRPARRWPGCTNGRTYRIARRRTRTRAGTAPGPRPTHGGAGHGPLGPEGAALPHLPDP